ncbi:sigma-70 family RNA polymerase sigma factor [Pendulispora albinea]|uniref:Sigma-70 family RNA polymerase sigma factor n=1 Tax=Pendulispora albinea TaxID=2741071 RepID=A0ABZ2M929_9BACT
MRQRILVGSEGAGPKLAEYRGRGALRRWLRVVAVRTALNLVDRPERGLPMSDRSWERFPAPDDLELAYFRTLYRAEFDRALRDAAARLTPRERLLLRQSFIDGWTIDDLGSHYHVHRATASRWLLQARERLVTMTRELLMERLRCSRSRLESALALVRSELHISLSSLL